jgi:chemotaxis protein CheX
MARKPQRRTGPPIILPETLDLPAAAPLTATLLARRGQDVALDASAVQRLGAQCLQVLLAAQAAWAEDGQNFRLYGASAELAEAAALLGAPDLIPAPDPIAA